MFIGYAKVFVWITTNYGKFFKRWEKQTTLPASWDNCVQVKKQQLEPDIKRLIPSWERSTPRLHIAAPLIYITWNAGLDEAQAGIKIAGRIINNLRYADDTNLKVGSKEELKSLLIKVKEESEKAVLKLSIQKTKIMASGPITLWQIDGEIWKQWESLFLWAPKSLQMVTAAMKLKDAYSLEGKLWPT